MKTLSHSDIFFLISWILNPWWDNLIPIHMGKAVFTDQQILPLFDLIQEKLNWNNTKSLRIVLMHILVNVNDREFKIMKILLWPIDQTILILSKSRIFLHIQCSLVGHRQRLVLYQGMWTVYNNHATCSVTHRYIKNIKKCCLKLGTCHNPGKVSEAMKILLIDILLKWAFISIYT